jgi:hypothetical protein
VADQKKDIKLLESQGYQAVYSQDGLVVLHRAAGPLICTVPPHIDASKLPKGQTPLSLFMCRP